MPISIGFQINRGMLMNRSEEPFEIPTQICVLGHITTQIEAVKNGAPADMIFQSIAGSEKATELLVLVLRRWKKPWHF